MKASDTFDPKSVNIRELFGDTSSLFQIPNYQRPYSWQDDEVERLWDDVYSAYQNNLEDPTVDSNYFLGSIISVAPQSNGYSDVVDGQQRLTTLMILLCVVRDLFPKLHDDVDISTNPDFIKSGRIKKCIFDDDDRSRLKLLTHASHQNDFDRLIVNKINLEDLKKPSKTKLSGASPNSRFINTAFIFKKKLEEIGESNSGQLINYLFNNVRLIKINCLDRTFAIKLFQVLNARGMPLTSSDLIKSYLLSRLPEEKHSQFTADWQKIEAISEDAEIEMEELWTLYEYYLLGANPKKSIYEEMIALFKDQNPNAVVNDFKLFASIYRDKIFETESKVVFSLWYIHWEMYWKMIALTAYKDQFSETENLLKEIRRFYYLYWMSGKTLTAIKQTSFNVVKWIKDKKEFSFIKMELENKISDEKILKSVNENLKGDVYYERWLKPLLLTIDYHQTDDSKSDYIFMDKSLHIEHILPLECSKFDEWSHFSKEDAEKNWHKLGNLTLLSGKKNIEASNNPFKIKLGIYSGQGKHNNKKEGITSFEITKKIVHDNIQTWTQDEIKNRFNWYLTEIESIFEIDFSSIKSQE